MSKLIFFLEEEDQSNENIKNYKFHHYFFLSFQITSEVKELTILHTNDLHAHLFPRIAPWISESRKIGGFANLATLVKQEKD